MKAEHACLLAGFLALTGCATFSERDAMAERPVLTQPFGASEHFDGETDFSRSVAARYGGLEATTITRDLARQGFACRGLAPVEARPDYALFECVRTDKIGAACFHVTSIILRRDPNTVDGAHPVARHDRRCLGALAPKG
jgi:hypothetical protein